VKQEFTSEEYSILTAGLERIMDGDAPWNDLEEVLTLLCRMDLKAASNYLRPLSKEDVNTYNRVMDNFTGERN